MIPSRRRSRPEIKKSDKAGEGKRRGEVFLLHVRPSDLSVEAEISVLCASSIPHYVEFLSRNIILSDDDIICRREIVKSILAFQIFFSFTFTSIPFTFSSPTSTLNTIQHVPFNYSQISFQASLQAL